MSDHTPLSFAERLDRYLAGACTPDEAAIVAAWLAERPEHERIAHVLGAPGFDAESREAPNTDDAWSRFDRKYPANALVDVPRETVSSARRRALSSSHWTQLGVQRWFARSAYAVAATVAVLALGALAGRWVTLAVQRRTPRITYTAYTTQRGQVAHFTLADGTRLTLAPNSRVGVAKDFPSHRDIVLVGEAYFDVTSRSDVPFLVHTGAITTRVLGTTFDVRRYPADRETRVEVVSGKVAVGAPRQASVTLVAGSIGHVTDSTAIATRVGDGGDVTEWTAGRLRFRDVPLPDVLAQLSRWYDLDFQLADSAMNHEVVTTAIDYTETSDVVRALEVLLDVTATTEKTTAGRPMIVLHPRGTSATPASTGTRFLPRQITHREVGR